MVITSVQNEKIKELKKLMTDKSLVFFDNPKLVEEAFLSGHNIIYLIKKEGYVGKADYGGQVVEVSENVFNTFSQTITSQGLIGVVKFNTLPINKPKNNFLVLDKLQDPGNIGTLIRSACGANFLDIYLLDCCKVTNDKVIRASMGTIFKTRIYQITQKEFIENFKKWNLPLYTCDMCGTNIYEKEFEDQCGIIVGNEGQGVSNAINEIANQKIKIPMLNDLESLNAGVSGSIIMYEITNKK